LSPPPIPFPVPLALFAAQFAIHRFCWRLPLAGEDEGVDVVRRRRDAKSDVEATSRVKAASDLVSLSRKGAVSSFWTRKRRAGLSCGWLYELECIHMYMI
jgi:hypothetical protein